MLLTLTCLLAAVTPLLQAQPMVDVIGIYFDEDASNHCATLPTGEVHRAYVIVTNLQDPTGLSGWECMVLLDGPIMVVNWDIGEAINPFSPPQFSVGLFRPMARSPVMVLMEISFLLTDEARVSFYLHHIFTPSLPDVPVYASGHDPGLLRPFHQSTGGLNFPVAVVNGDCPVASEGTSWGNVKALYR